MGCKNCNDPCKKTVIDSKGEKGDKGPQGEPGTDGADGLSQLVLKEHVEKITLQETGDYSTLRMIGDGTFYIDLEAGMWMVEFSAMLGSDSTQPNNRFEYMIQEDGDQSDTGGNANDILYPVSQRSEIIVDPDVDEHHSIYTTAYISVDAPTRIKAYYAYAQANEADEYFVQYATLRAVKFQDVNEQ